MTHQALKISLMEQSKFIKYSLILSIFILLSGCQHSWVERSQINLNEIIFGYDIDDSFKKKSKNYFIKTPNEKSLNLSISNLIFKKKNFYGGYSARTKQIEIIGELQYRFYDQDINRYTTLILIFMIIIEILYNLSPNISTSNIIETIEEKKKEIIDYISLRQYKYNYCQ